MAEPPCGSDAVGQAEVSSRQQPPWQGGAVVHLGGQGGGKLPPPFLYDTLGVGLGLTIPAEQDPIRRDDGKATAACALWEHS